MISIPERRNLPVEEYAVVSYLVFAGLRLTRWCQPPDDIEAQLEDLLKCPDDDELEPLAGWEKSLSKRVDNERRHLREQLSRERRASLKATASRARSLRASAGHPRRVC